MTLALSPYEITVPYSKLKIGSNTLEATVFDSQGRVAKKETIKLVK